MCRDSKLLSTYSTGDRDRCVARPTGSTRPGRNDDDGNKWGSAARQKSNNVVAAFDSFRPIPIAISVRMQIRNGN